MKNITQKIIDFILKISKKIFPETIIKLEEKFLTVEVILYVFFGVLTTIVNLIISYVLEGSLHVNGAIASFIGILAAVLFAYFTNRKLVFNSQAIGFVQNLKEFFKFMLGRAVTMVFEEGGVIIFYNLLHLPFKPVKLILTILVIIINFFFSKFF